MRLSHHIFLGIIFTIFLIVPAGCNFFGDGNDATKQRFLDMRKQAIDASLKDDFRRNDSIAAELYKEASEVNDKVNMAYGLLFQSCITKDPNEADERFKKLKAAETLALETGNDTLLSRIYNMLGLYATYINPNFSEARQNFTKAIEYLDKCNERRYIISVECNIAELYYTLEDTIGIRYDRDIYQYALDTQNERMLVSSGRRLAKHYISKDGEEDLALPFINSIGKKNDGYLAHLLKALYYIKKDSLRQADRELAGATKTGLQSPELFYYYALLFNKTGDYQQSIQKLDTACILHEKVDRNINSYIRYLKLYADNYRHLDNPSKTLIYQDLYINSRDSINKIKNLAEINDYKVKYEVQKKELELAKQKHIIRSQRFIIWSVFITICLIIVFYMLYRRRRRKMQKLIVHHQANFIREREEMLPLSQSIPADTADDEEESPTSTIPRERADVIWRKILHEMEENKIFKDLNVTRDSFSARVGCNHTWFSRIIKERTGMSYPQFMNSWRIKEAVKILSNPDEIQSQKELCSSLGFLSTSSFYATFKKEMGMSPAEYRKFSLDEAKHKGDAE